MPILTITLEVNEQERATLLNQIADRGGIVVKAPENGYGHDTTDGDADPNAPAVDKNGIPWDSRIHSSNKKLNADGTWRRQRGVTDEVFNKVTAELKGAAPAPEPVGTTTESVSAPAPAQESPSLPGIPTDLPNPVDLAPIPPAPVLYEDIIAKFKVLSESGKVNSTNYAKAYELAGVTDVAALQTDETLRRKLMDVFESVENGTVTL